MFARVVIELGGEIEDMLAVSDYRSREVKLDNVAGFDDLIGKTRAVTTMPLKTPNRGSYMAASEAAPILACAGVDTPAPRWRRRAGATATLRWLGIAYEGAEHSRQLAHVARTSPSPAT